MASALFLIGVSGAGKSTMAQALGAYLTGHGLRTAVIDTDALGQFGPGPSSPAGRSDLYNGLKCRNLAAVWANYRPVADYMVVAAAGMVTRQLREQYVQSLDGCDSQVAQLLAPPSVVLERLRRRHGHLSSHPGTHNSDLPVADLDSIAADMRRLDNLGLADFVVRNDRAAPEVAVELARRAGWFP
ncbi:MAG TPA: AAA family ATPase [Acidimicrobiales bacterium]